MLYGNLFLRRDHNESTDNHVSVLWVVRVFCYDSRKTLIWRREPSAALMHTYRQGNFRSWFISDRSGGLVALREALSAASRLGGLLFPKTYFLRRHLICAAVRYWRPYSREPFCGIAGLIDTVADKIKVYFVFKFKFIITNRLIFFCLHYFLPLLSNWGLIV